jgi:hypothetical protein
MSNKYETCQGDKTLKLVMCYDDDEDEIYMLRFEWDDEVLQKGRYFCSNFCFMKY